ncbi:hypothetical protein AL755_00605 (plasmid) [Arthrobacter sp. ERGS1:01]|uniref:LysR family transcriptional regulator n=1 Tax=Arthrobacter sp. ERGS1:01 TaxID=1704044 RepID=UPI0006B42ED0|nr:LysR family transcriptional regulator [Arthrobacter sp. ERGS1:01]ALE04253.1 hypothetical protein AL755_00605 [Arthrobacter sp. ERGS1:01]
MDPRKLEHFLAVADSLSFTKAAKTLHIAQPSLSQSIKSLERELKTDLFVRLPSGLELTPGGKALMSPASRALRALKDAREMVRSLTDVQGGTLDIVAPASLITYPTARLVHRFNREYPRVNVTVREAADSAEAANQLLDGRAEVAVFEMTGSATGIVRHKLFSYELYAVFPAGTPNAPDPQVEIISWSALERHRLISLAPYTVSRKMIERHGLSGNIGIEVHSIEAAVELVRLGAGVGVLVEPYALMAQRDGATIFRLEPQVVHSVGTGHRRGEVAPAVTAFTNLAMLHDPEA